MSALRRGVVAELSGAQISTSPWVLARRGCAETSVLGRLGERGLIQARSDHRWRLAGTNRPSKTCPPSAQTQSSPEAGRHAGPPSTFGEVRMAFLTDYH